MSIKWYRWYVYMRTQCFEMLVECGVYCDFPFTVKTKDKQTDSLMYLYFTTTEEKKQKKAETKKRHSFLFQCCAISLTTLTWQNKKTPHNEVDTLSIYSPARANGYANLKGDCFFLLYVALWHDFLWQANNFSPFSINFLHTKQSTLRRRWYNQPFYQSVLRVCFPFRLSSVLFGFIIRISSGYTYSSE